MKSAAPTQAPARANWIRTLALGLSMTVTTTLAGAEEENKPTDNPASAGTPTEAGDERKATPPASPKGSATRASRPPTPKRDFRPSEQIKEDFSVPFPVDI